MSQILDGQFLTMRLEDGEQVVRLKGGRGARRYNSDRPHAGVWGPETDYVLVPCRSSRQAKLRAGSLLSSFPMLDDRSPDDGILMLGAPAAIYAVLTQGPAWCQALVSRKGQPRSKAQQEAARRLAAG